MPLPRWLARLNRLATNRLAVRIGPRAAGLGVLTHRGRRTERTYRTPVAVFRHRDDDGTDEYVVALTYGTCADRIRTVLAAEGCDLRSHGRSVRLGSPRLRYDPSCAAAPRPVRSLLRRIAVTDFVVLSPAPAR